VVATNAFIVRTRSMPSVVKARGLAEWIYWIHSSEAGQTIADAHQVIPSGSSPVLMRRITAAVVNITVDGVAVSPLAGCADAASGVLCSERGNCSSAGRCVCEVGWHGDLCELADAAASGDGSSDTTALTVALSTVVPAAVVALCLLAVCSALALLVVHRRGRLDNYDWEIDPAELELGDQLGAGGYGVVHKALWKGTEVAVKMIGGDAVAYGSVQVANFRREAQVMSALRHPNVVLFMAACTKPPKMCIVMEFMSLGSLYDVRLSPSRVCGVRVLCVLPCLVCGGACAVKTKALSFRAVAPQRPHRGHSDAAAAQDHLPGGQGHALPPLVGRCAPRPQVAQPPPRLEVERQGL
jgi:hypothetical protein